MDTLPKEIFKGLKHEEGFWVAAFAKRSAAHSAMSVKGVDHHSLMPLLLL